MILEGFLWVKFKLKGDLKRMHEEILEELSSLGETHPYSLNENYQPHLSLLRYKDENFNPGVFTKKLRINKVNFNSKWNYLAYAYGEEHGTVSKVIKKYKLES